MKELKKYVGRKLTTDEIAEARNIRNRLLSELETMVFETGEYYITFKWGTLKSWHLPESCNELIKEYNSIGSSMSVIMQKDTERQRELICKMIDEVDGGLCSDWSGEYFTKQQAKDYVMENTD